MATNTPFFQAFGALLFGRPPRKVIGKVKELGSLGELYELFGEMLPDHLLSKSENGLNSRDRTLTPKVTFWAFVSQVFDVGSSCRDVVRKVEAWWRWMQKESASNQPTPSPSAYCQARARLDMQMLRLIHGHLAWSLERRVQSAQLWLGRRVKIVDGTTLSMPDTVANCAKLAATLFAKRGPGLSLHEAGGNILSRQRRPRRLCHRHPAPA